MFTLRNFVAVGIITEQHSQNTFFRYTTKVLWQCGPAHMGRMSTCQKMDHNSPAAQDNEAACKCLLELDWHGTGSIFRMGSAAFIAKIHIGSINVSAPKPANGFYMYLRYHCTVVKYCGPFSDVQHINRENTFTTGHSPNPGSHFTKDFSIVIKIRWKIDYVAIYFLAITSLQRFAHAATAQLLCHVKKIVTITLLEFRWEQN